jgi:hypothetical protein
MRILHLYLRNLTEVENRRGAIGNFGSWMKPAVPAIVRGSQARAIAHGIVGPRECHIGHVPRARVFSRGHFAMAIIEKA